MKHQWKLIDGENWYKFDSKFDRFKYHYGHWIGIILSVVVIISILAIGIYLVKNKTAFYENPLVYGLKQIGEQNDGIAFCNCIINQFDGGVKDFKINETGFVVEKRAGRIGDRGVYLDPEVFKNITVVD